MYYYRTFLIVLTLLGLFSLGLCVRRYVLLSSYNGIESARVPFTLESALQMRRVKLILDRGELPVRDRMVSMPEGVAPSREYTVFVDYLQAYLCNVGLPHELPARLRWIETLLACLTIPLLALWGWQVSRRWSVGFVTALLYAVSIAAVQRSTGAELSTENTSFPFLAAHFFFQARALAVGVRHLVWALSSATALAFAVLSWDLMQFYLFIWSGIGAWKILTSTWRDQEPALRCWRIEWVALIAVALLSEYHRSHGLLTSPPMVLAAAVTLVCTLRGKLWVRPRSSTTYIIVVPLVAFLISVFVLSGKYGGAYGHFEELVWAKIRFFNIKPVDQELLTFNQRLLWTPALHSPTIRLTAEIVGLACLICLAGFLTLWKKSRSNLNCLQALAGFGCSLVAYVLFFRFHVFVAFFGAMLVGLLWSYAEDGRSRFPVLVRVSIALCIFAELAHTLGGPWIIRFADREKLAEALDGRPPAALWGTRDGIYFEEQVELTNWLENNAAPDTVLAGFGLSGPIAAYGKCGVILHPKFETEAAREKVRQYAEKLYLGTLPDLRAWADEHGASWLVYGMGSFSTQEPTLQLRYMVDAMNPPPMSPARLFESGAKVGPYFREVFANRKYKVYRIMTAADEMAAKASLARAIAAFEQGRLAVAEREATSTLRANPTLRRAEEILKHVETLRAGGFTIEDER